MKTQEQINEAIEILKENRKVCKSHNMFNESNHDKLDAQIRMLEENMDEDEIYEAFEDDEDGSAAAAAEQLYFDWVNDDFADMDDLQDFLYPIN